jgi:hypothetical protein
VNDDSVPQLQITEKAFLAIDKNAIGGGKFVFLPIARLVLAQISDRLEVHFSQPLLQGRSLSQRVWVAVPGLPKKSTAQIIKLRLQAIAALIRRLRVFCLANSVASASSSRNRFAN